MMLLLLLLSLDDGGQWHSIVETQDNKEMEERKRKKSSISFFPCTVKSYLKSVPVNDWATRVLDHFFPVLELTAFAAVAKDNLSDGVGRPDAIVITDRQLEVDSLGNGWGKIEHLSHPEGKTGQIKM